MHYHAESPTSRSPAFRREADADNYRAAWEAHQSTPEYRHIQQAILTLACDCEYGEHCLVWPVLAAMS